MATWYFSCLDNGGYKQIFKVKANSKPEAIDKAMTKARKKAKGSIGYDWKCWLHSA